MEGDNCQPGTWDSACGLNGATCVNCFGWQHCEDGECVDNEEPDGGVDDGSDGGTDGGKR